MNIIQDVLVLLVGLIISIVASQKERARRDAQHSARTREQARREAEDLAASLAQEQARTDLERKRLEAIFESIADGVSFYDSEGRIQHLNAAALDLYGLDDDSTGRSISIGERGARIMMRDEEGRRFTQEQWPVRRILSGEVISSARAEDVVFTNLRGREIEISVSGMPVRAADGRIVGAVTVMRDVTERRQLERRTRKALGAFLAIAEALVQAPNEQAGAAEEPTPTAGLVVQRLAELTRNVLECTCISLYSVESETGMVTPLTILSLTPEHERRWWAGERPGSRLIDGSNPEIATRLRAGEALVLEMAECPSMGQSDPSNTQIMLLAPMRIGEWLVGVMMLARGGTTNRYTEEEIALAKAVARLGALVIERERLLREREEARANELALRETTRQMDVFMGMASHELKTPLTTIILGLQAMQRRLHSLSHDAPKAADAPGAVFESLLGQLVRTRRQVGRLNRLVDDLLDVSRIQAGKLELRREPADLALLLREILEEQRQAHPQRSIQLHLPAIPAQPVMADVGRIGQVVTNYLTNALKYSAEDSPVEVGFEVTEGSARVWVRDQGPGLPQDEQERIWERFHRAKGVQVRSGTGVGLGLGLYISQTIIERHQGHVGVESAPGKGSTFWFTLPFVISVQAE